MLFTQIAELGYLHLIIDVVTGWSVVIKGGNTYLIDDVVTGW